MTDRATRLRRALLTPGGYWRTALQWLVVFALAVPLFSAWALGRESWTLWLINDVSSTCLCSLIMAHFTKRVGRVVPVADVQRFESALRSAASALGYQPSATASGVISCRPVRCSGLPAAWLSVELRAGEATIVGSNLAVRRLQLELGYRGLGTLDADSAVSG